MIYLQTLVDIKKKGISLKKALVVTLVGAMFTAICAQLSFYLPGNPIPVTLQVFAVICCGVILGSKLGAIAQLQYLAAGLMGAPVFAGFKSGPAWIAGPTGGYLVGFVLAAYVAGKTVELLKRNDKSAIMMSGLFGVFVVYITGAAWLSVWMRIAGSSLPNWQNWLMGISPFICIDFMKVAAAAIFCPGKKI